MYLKNNMGNKIRKEDTEVYLLYIIKPNIKIVVEVPGWLIW